MQSLAITLSVLTSNIFLARYGGPVFPYIKKTPSRPLIFLLIFTHAYHIIFCHSCEGRNPVNSKDFGILQETHIKIRDESFGLMKIIKDNVTRVWKSQKTKEKIIDLEDWENK